MACFFFFSGGVECGGLGEGEELPQEFGMSVLSFPWILVSFEGSTKTP